MKPGDRAEPEVGPCVEARLARPAGVALLGGCVRIAGAGYESGRFAREHPFAGRPEFRPQADVRIVKAVIGVWRRVPQRVMLERGLTKNGQRIGKPVLHVGLRVDAALADRRIAAPGRAEARPAIEGCDQLPASLRQRPGAAKGASRRADDRRERACGDPRTPKLQAGAGQERAPPALVLTGALPSLEQAGATPRDDLDKEAPPLPFRQARINAVNGKNVIHAEGCAAFRAVAHVRPLERATRTISGAHRARRSRGSGRGWPARAIARRLIEGAPMLNSLRRATRVPACARQRAASRMGRHPGTDRIP